MYLLRDVDHKATILTIIKNQLTHMQSTGLPTYLEGLNALYMEENSTYLVRPERDDEPITSTTEVIPSQLHTCPYSFTLTLPTFTTAAYGLLLASRQTRWTTSIPDLLVPTTIIQLIRQAILLQIPTITRANTKAPMLSQEVSSITSLSFTGHRPT